MISLFTRWFHRFALIIGWAVGMAYGTVQAYRTPGGGQAHFGATAAPLFGQVIYIGVIALVINLVVAAVLTVVFRKIGLQDGYDKTRPADYTADPEPVPRTTLKTKTLSAEVRISPNGSNGSHRFPNGSDGNRRSANGVDGSRKWSYRAADRR